MPPKKKAAQTAAQKDQCCVCCQPIAKGKDDTLFCAGDCQQWLHRYCAGVSAQCYRSITEKVSPFLCFACCLVRHKDEIDSLKDAVELLKGEIATLKSSQLSQSSQSTTQASSVLLSAPSPNPPEPTSGPTTTSVNGPTTTSVNVSTFPLASPLDGHERKFNVVVYGVEECSRGSSKVSRLKEDMVKVVSALSKVDNSIGSQSIKDVFRLGRFSIDNKKPRPLLVKFIRAADASGVLSKRGSLRNSTLSIKPDMSPTERKSESILLKERWSLIQSGVPRAVIRVRGSRLLVRNKTHGQIKISGSTPHYSVSNSAVHTSSPIVTTQSPTMTHPQSDNSPTVQNNFPHTTESPQNQQNQPPAPSPQSTPMSDSEQ